jgi:hypothetical protein
MAMSPTARTLAKLRKEGWLAWVVEKYIPQVRQRSDLFGFIDVLAIRGDETLGVQSTSRTNVSSRVNKITDHENLAAVRAAGWQIHVHGWGKMANGRWECRVVDLS